MDYEFYDNWEFVKDFSEFTFISLGKCGPILKKVLFDRTEVPGLYNLVFGDVDDTGEIDDYSISDNGDRNKILATVAKIVERYSDHYPERWICFTGSTEARTRLYRMAIGMNLEKLSKNFEIYGGLNDNGELFRFYKNLPVCTFYIKRKIT